MAVGVVVLLALVLPACHVHVVTTAAAIVTTCLCLLLHPACPCSSKALLRACGNLLPPSGNVMVPLSDIMLAQTAMQTCTNSGGGSSGDGHSGDDPISYTID